MKSKYPLESLKQLRSQRVDQATEALARAVKERERAHESVLRAAEAKKAHERSAAQKRASEERSLEEGALTAADLARREAWEFQVRKDLSKLQREIDAALASESQAREQEAGAQNELASRKAEAEVVDKHEARFDQKQTQRALTSEEEAAEEAWRPRRA